LNEFIWCNRLTDCYKENHLDDKTTSPLFTPTSGEHLETATEPKRHASVIWISSILMKFIRMDFHYLINIYILTLATFQTILLHFKPFLWIPPVIYRSNITMYTLQSHLFYPPLNRIVQGLFLLLLLFPIRDLSTDTKKYPLDVPHSTSVDQMFDYPVLQMRNLPTWSSFHIWGETIKTTILSTSQSL